MVDDGWERDGFLLHRGAIGVDACEAMLERVTQIVRTATRGEAVGDALVPVRRAGATVAIDA
jgi:hypothetical protein